MIVVREVVPGQFEPITGNPTLVNLEGAVKAPLLTILHESWTAEERAKFGIYLVEAAPIPAGTKPIGSVSYQRQKGRIVEIVEVEEVSPPLDDRTPEEKVTAMAAAFGLSLNDLKSVLVGEKHSDR